MVGQGARAVGPPPLAFWCSRFSWPFQVRPPATCVIDLTLAHCHSLALGCEKSTRSLQVGRKTAFPWRFVLFIRSFVSPFAPFFCWLYFLVFVRCPIRGVPTKRPANPTNQSMRTTTTNQPTHPPNPLANDERLQEHPANNG